MFNVHVPLACELHQLFHHVYNIIRSYGMIFTCDSYLLLSNTDFGNFY